MTFKDYGDQAIGTAIYPDKGRNHIYPVLGLVGEAGEVAEKVKKILRDKQGIMTETDKAEIAKELGDVLWYCNAAAYELGTNLEAVAQQNIDKLRSRKERGVMAGSGDNR